jgi:hypothetical protein
LLLSCPFPVAGDPKMPFLLTEAALRKGPPLIPPKRPCSVEVREASNEDGGGAPLRGLPASMLASRDAPTSDVLDSPAGGGV